MGNLTRVQFETWAVFEEIWYAFIHVLQELMLLVLVLLLVLAGCMH